MFLRCRARWQIPHSGSCCLAGAVFGKHYTSKTIWKGTISLLCWYVIYFCLRNKTSICFLPEHGSVCVEKEKSWPLSWQNLEPLLKPRSPCCFRQLFQMWVKWKGQNCVARREHKGSHYPPASAVRRQPVFKPHLSVINFFTYKCHPKWTFYSWLIFVLFLICKYKSKMHTSSRFPLCWLKSWFSSYLLPSALAEKWLFKPRS